MLARQAALHLAARLASVALSFVIFAWLGRLLSPSDAASVYAFTFSFGFALATLRMCLQLGAGVDGLARFSVRLRQARRGYATLASLLPILALVVATTTWAHTHSWLLTGVAAVTAVIAAPDVDLLRGLKGKASLFSFSFSIGSLLTLAMLQWVVPATVHGVVFALICQWLPVAIMNASAWFLYSKGRLSSQLKAADVAGTLLLAGFDGLILNLPFLGVLALPIHVSIDISVVMRIFVASLPMLPLLLHWSNSKAFSELSQVIGLRPKTGFICALWLSGLLAGSVFLLTYWLISGKNIQAENFFLYLLLLSGYALFAPNMRHVSGQRERSTIWGALLIILFGYILALGMSSLIGYPFGAWTIVITQTLALLVTGLYFAKVISKSSQLNTGV